MMQPDMLTATDVATSRREGRFMMPTLHKPMLTAGGLCKPPKGLFGGKGAPLEAQPLNPMALVTTTQS